MSTVAVDFDGVIHKYSKGWHDGSIYDEPVEGSFKALHELMVKYAVFIHTTRRAEDVAGWLCHKGNFFCLTEDVSMDWRWHLDDRVTQNIPNCAVGTHVPRTEPRVFWNDHGVLLVTNRKLPAIAYIDDRAVRFRGDWSRTLKDLREFER